MAKKKKTSKYTNRSFPTDCPHLPFFGCRSPNQCIACYYNPNEAQSRMAKSACDEEDHEPGPWFYEDKKHAKVMLAMLENIHHGRGLMKGGHRCWFKNAKRKRRGKYQLFDEDD